MRRALGYKLLRQGPMLMDFIGYLERVSAGTVTIETAVAWATQPVGAALIWWKRRLTVVRGFARHLKTLDPACQVPPTALLPSHSDRITPYLFSPQEIAALIHAAGALRRPLLAATYQALISLLAVTGMRIGEALGLRHEDIAAAAMTVTIRPRLNANGARTMSATGRTIPISAELVRLLADYLHDEYGDLDSDYVFVSLWSHPRGQALTYAAVYDLVRRLRRRTGIDFDPHWWRHTYATRLRRGTGMESVKELLGHASITTTIDTYGNPQELHQTGEKRQAARSERHPTKAPSAYNLAA